MLKIFFGANRLEAEKKVKQFLGGEYEVFEGENLTVADLPSIFQGTSLFETAERKILLKDVGENSAVWEKVADYAETGNRVAIWEGKIDKRSSGYKRLKEAGVEMLESTELVKPEARAVFNVLDTALRDGPAAVAMVEKIELEQDPYMFFGLLVTQALKKFEQSGGAERERKLVKTLARTDMEMKSTSVEPWLLVKSWLLEVGEL